MQQPVSLPHLSISPVIFTAAGEKDSGRETAMTLLTDILWDAGHRKLVYHNFEEENYGQFIKKYQTLNWAPYGTPKNAYPIILIPRVNKDDYNFLCNYANVILFIINRNNNKPSNDAHVQGNGEVSDHYWYYRSIQGKAYPLSNTYTEADGFRLLSFHLRNLFENEIKNSQLWKNIYANNNTY